MFYIREKKEKIVTRRSIARCVTAWWLSQIRLMVTR